MEIFFFFFLTKYYGKLETNVFAYILIFGKSEINDNLNISEFNNFPNKFGKLKPLNNVNHIVH